MITIAVDCMGGDHGLPITLPACADFLASHPDAFLLLVGQPEAIQTHAQFKAHERSAVVAASEVVAMDDPLSLIHI